jgi:AcrR family transcriptional regulator
MARVNLERRAEIGRQKSARTRAAILDAARSLLAAVENPVVTVESVTQAAGVAKGTFYLHFADLSTLEAELGDELVAELTDRLEPGLRSFPDPLIRMATGVMIFLRDLASTPMQARLAAHAIASLPNVGHEVRKRLHDDLAQARDAGLLAVGSVDLATGMVAGLVEQAARLLGTGRTDADEIPDIVRAILRAMGNTPDEAKASAAVAASHADAFAGRGDRPA